MRTTSARARAAALCRARPRRLRRSCPAGPSPSRVELRPDEVKDFAVLYAENCAGCHGPDGQGRRRARAREPRVPRDRRRRDRSRRVIANGVPGTPMPAFAQQRGRNAHRRADRRSSSAGSAPLGAAGCARRRHAASLSRRRRPANAARGAAGLRRRTARRATARTARADRRRSSIVDGSYLALVSDQGLRTTVIAGRPDLGQPDWRGDVAGRAAVGAGGHRRRGLARVAAATVPGPAVSRRHSTDEEPMS